MSVIEIALEGCGSPAELLKFKIEERTARIKVIGLGYVGLPLALTVHESGFAVSGLDLNRARVSAINDGAQVISYFEERRVAEAVASGRFSATDDYASVAAADVILLCVPTPLSDKREPDLAQIIRAAESMIAYLRPGQLIVVESTVWPGATSTLLRPILERSGLRAGADFFLGFSPEREDPGNKTHSTRTIPKIVGADDPISRDLLETFYSQVVTQTVPVDSCAIAEAVKLVENSFRTVNIALVNELKVALDAMGIDVWTVIDAAATKPFGFMPFYPGPGIGGDCIPVSPAYLSWRALDVGSELPIVDLARVRAAAAPSDLAVRIASDLNTKAETAIQGARVLLLGVAYKKDVEDTRESPALYMMQHLEAMGAFCDFHDPYFPVLPQTRDHPSLAGRISVSLNAETLAAYDAVVVTTDHSEVDYAAVAGHAPMIFDTRNVFDRAGIAIEGNRTLVKI